MESKVSGLRFWLLAGLIASALAVSVPTAANQHTHLVGPTDTLWSIARSTRPNDRVTIKQAMLAIHDANPKAFPTGNINEMEVGERLRIPNLSAMTRRSPTQADQEVRRHNQAWVASKAPAAPKPVSVRATTTASSNPAPAPVATPAAGLSLTQVDPEQHQLERLEAELASSAENLQIAARENDQLAERLSSLQQQMSTLQQLIQLKDQQLVAMEEQLLQEQKRPLTLVPAATASVQEPTQASDLAQQLAHEIKQQPVLYALVTGLSLLALLLFVGLLTSQRKLKRAAATHTTAKNSTEAGLMAAFATTTAAAAATNLSAGTASTKSTTAASATPLPDLEELEDLGELDSLEGFEELDETLDLVDLETLTSTDESNLALDSEQGLDFDLDDLEILEPAEQPADSAAPVADLDPLQEAQTYIAYGRLEQAAGFLQQVLEQQPQREDLRLQLLEVLAELKAEETFAEQRRLLVANQASSSALQQAEQLAQQLQAQTRDAASLDEDSLDLDKDLAEFNQLYPNNAAALEDSVVAELQELDTQDPSSPSLQSLEAELDELESNLEEPLLLSELSSVDELDTEFEPVNYVSDADDFMQALDSLSPEDLEPLDADTSEPSGLQPAPGVEDELAALTENMAELTALTTDEAATAHKPVEDPLAVAELDLSAFDDLNDLADLDDFDDLSLSAFDELDEPELEELDANSSSLSAQLDLATAYIEMGDLQGAQEILEKVAQEGDESSKATALQMLSSIK